MNSRILLFISSICTIVTIALFSCKDKKPVDDGVVTVRIGSDPGNLNYTNTNSATAVMIAEFIFGQVNSGEVDGNFKLLPYLTNDLGTISEINEGEWKGGMRLDYEIRPEARWDNGTSITADDYIFTVKAILNPKTNCEGIKTFYDWVGDIVKDSTNPRKFTIYANKKYFKIEELAGAYILPEYNYDPLKLMRNYTIRDLNSNDKREALRGDSIIIKFAQEYNSVKYQRDPKFITGLGPYKLDKWIAGQEVVLKRKDSWWGDKFSYLRQFVAHPKVIKFKIVTDMNTAVTALKGGAFDAFENIASKNYKELSSNVKFKETYRLEKKDFFIFTFISLNLRNNKFKDLNVRKAIAHAIDRNKINDIEYGGDMRLTESFVHPLQYTYNKNIKPYLYDQSLANTLLDEAGWIDSDGDDIRDKRIGGVRVPFKVILKIGAGNEARKNVALLLQEQLKQVGIEIELQIKEPSVLNEELERMDYEMSVSALTITPRISDPKQIWHTANAGIGGDNRCGWGSEVSDKLIDDLIVELDPQKRQEMYMNLQQMIHDDVPVIYLFAGKNRMAIKKKFDVQTIMINPGFYLGDFKQLESEQ
ncbi:MAG: ABC transporter substrate-binding protein [Chitinophagales bacterium]